MGEAISVLKTELDQSHMRGAIAGFPDQITQSFAIMNNWEPQNEYLGIQKIMVLGMGYGLSGIRMDRKKKN